MYRIEDLIEERDLEELDLLDGIINRSRLS